MPKPVCYNFEHLCPSGEVEFLSKNNSIFLSQDIPYVGGSASKWYPTATGAALFIFWEFIPKLGQKKIVCHEILKKFRQNYSRASKALPFIRWHCVNHWKVSTKGKVKFQGNPIQAHEERLESVYCSLWPWSSRGKVGFPSKSKPIFSPLKYSLGQLECPQVVPHHCWEIRIVFQEFILKLG